MQIFKNEEALKKHDWYYMMSEDVNTYESGKMMHNRLLRLTILSTEHKKLFTKYSEKIKF